MWQEAAARRGPASQWHDMSLSVKRVMALPPGSLVATRFVGEARWRERVLLWPIGGDPRRESWVTMDVRGALLEEEVRGWSHVLDCDAATLRHSEGG